MATPNAGVVVQPQPRVQPGAGQHTSVWRVVGLPILCLAGLSLLVVGLVAATNSAAKMADAEKNAAEPAGIVVPTMPPTSLPPPKGTRVVLAQFTCQPTKDVISRSIEWSSNSRLTAVEARSSAPLAILRVDDQEWTNGGNGQLLVVRFDKPRNLSGAIVVTGEPHAPPCPRPAIYVEVAGWVIK